MGVPRQRPGRRATDTEKPPSTWILGAASTGLARVVIRGPRDLPHRLSGGVSPASPPCSNRTTQGGGRPTVRPERRHCDDGARDNGGSRWSTMEEQRWSTLVVRLWRDADGLKIRFMATDSRGHLRQHRGRGHGRVGRAPLPGVAGDGERPTPGAGIDPTTPGDDTHEDIPRRRWIGGPGDAGSLASAGITANRSEHDDAGHRGTDLFRRGLTGYEVVEHEEPTYESGALSRPSLRASPARRSRGPPSTPHEALVAELEDEGFDEAVESLVDEVAGRHLTALARGETRSRPQSRTPQQWLEHFGGLRRPGAGRARGTVRRPSGLDSLGEAEAAGVLAESARDPDRPSEQFLGGLVKKAFSAARPREGRSPRAHADPDGPGLRAAAQAGAPAAQEGPRHGPQPAPAPLRGPPPSSPSRLGSPRREAEPRWPRLRRAARGARCSPRPTPRRSRSSARRGRRGLVGVRGPARGPGPGPRPARPAARRGGARTATRPSSWSSSSPS